MAQHRDLPGFGVDLDHGDVGTEGKGRTLPVEVVFERRPGSIAFGQAVRIERRSRQLAPPDRRGRYARNLEAVLALDDVGLGGFEHVGGESFRFVQHVLAGQEHGRSCALQRTGSHRALTSWHEVGVGLVEHHPIHGNAQNLADEHGEGGVVALTVGRGAHRRRHRPVRIDLDLAVLDVQTRRSGHLDVGRRSRRRSGGGHRWPGARPGWPASAHTRPPRGPHRGPFRNHRCHRWPRCGS